MSVAKAHEPPLTRRFHRRPGETLRRWERTLWSALFRDQPEARMWANVLADGIYIIYRSRRRKAVERELRWLCSVDDGTLYSFGTLAVAFDLEPDDIKRDILADVKAGKIAAEGVRCAY